MIKSPLPTKRILELNILPTRDEMGKMAAGDVAQAMNRFIKERGSVNIVFAAAPSQDEFLVHLSRKRNIDWSRVTCFHLDDYVDLPRNHPNTFEAYLQEHIFNAVRPKQIHFIKALKGTPGEVARKYTRLIEESGGIHISCIGIGENGHIAFCDPGSDLYDPRMIRIIRLDDRSVRQQYRDYKDHPEPRGPLCLTQSSPAQGVYDDRSGDPFRPGDLYHRSRAAESGGGKKDVGGSPLFGLSVIGAATAFPGKDIFR